MIILTDPSIMAISIFYIGKNVYFQVIACKYFKQSWNFHFFACKLILGQLWIYICLHKTNIFIKMGDLEFVWSQFLYVNKLKENEDADLNLFWQHIQIHN